MLRALRVLRGLKKPFTTTSKPWELVQVSVNIHTVIE